MAMGLSAGPGEGRVAPQINVTPLVDVVLVLLIIFMVVTPLLTKKFELHVPRKDTDEPADKPPPDQPAQLVLSLGKGGIIKINSEVVPRADLAGRLRRALAARQDGLLFFDAASDSAYGDAVELMDVARQSGASNITVVTEAIAD